MDIFARLVSRISVDGTASPIKAVIGWASCSNNTYLLRILYTIKILARDANREQTLLVAPLGTATWFS